MLCARNTLRCVTKVVQVLDGLRVDLYDKVSCQIGPPWSSKGCGGEALSNYGCDVNPSDIYVE